MPQYETIMRYQGSKTKILFGIIPALCLFLALQVTAMADGPQNKQAEEAIQSDDLDSVILHLKWYHQFQFAGYYAAVEKGYFRESGFDVTLVEGRPGRNAIDEVLAGRAQYGVSNVDVLLNRLKGKPVVVLAAIFQHSPFILLSLKNSGIATPQDLIGRRVMLMKGVNNAEVLAMLHNEGISMGQIRKIDTTFDINDLIDGKTDVFNAYITNEPYFLEKQGIPFSIIRPVTYGIDFYGDCLFAAEREVKDNPGRVKKFREASLRGWEYAMQHPEEIIDVILNKYGSKKTREHLRFEAKEMRNLIMPELMEMGHMNPGRWRHIADTLVQFEMADPEYFLKGFIYDPDPKPDYTWVRWIVGAALSISLLVGLSAVVLLIINRRFQREVNERRQAEAELVEYRDHLEEMVEG
ncbi:MAG: ABC transporter substrate-binding protein, partial [Deltaproteobacteria bacterium]|nr:ABC transporter substrate-binding protein [Deltaproteobacteria bacterium]